MTRPSLASIERDRERAARTGKCVDDAVLASHVPALTAALREVLRFHTEREHRPLDGIYLGWTVCNHCRRSWPCSTVLAITAHIDTTTTKEA